MMFGFGPQPPKELWQKKPDDLSAGSAASSWMAGYVDGTNNATHAIFDDEGVQMFYDDGYSRGEAERGVAEKLNGRHGNPRSGEQEEQKTGEQALKAYEEYSDLIVDSAAVLQAVSFAAIALALWTGRSGRRA